MGHLGMTKGCIKVGSRVTIPGGSGQYQVIAREEWLGGTVILRLRDRFGTIAATPEVCTRVARHEETDNGGMDQRSNQAPGRTAPGTGSGGEQANPDEGTGEGGEEQGEVGTEGEAGGTVEGIREEVAPRVCHTCKKPVEVIPGYDHQLRHSTTKSIFCSMVRRESGYNWNNNPECMDTAC